MNCTGYYVPEGNEESIIAKTTRLNMRIVNATIIKNKNGHKFICVLQKG